MDEFPYEGRGVVRRFLQFKESPSPEPLGVVDGRPPNVAHRLGLGLVFLVALALHFDDEIQRLRPTIMTRTM